MGSVFSKGQPDRSHTVTIHFINMSVWHVLVKVKQSLVQVTKLLMSSIVFLTLGQFIAVPI